MGGVSEILLSNQTVAKCSRHVLIVSFPLCEFLSNLKKTVYYIPIYLTLICIINIIVGQAIIHLQHPKLNDTSILPASLGILPFPNFTTVTRKNSDLSPTVEQCLLSRDITTNIYGCNKGTLRSINAEQWDQSVNQTCQLTLLREKKCIARTVRQLLPPPRSPEKKMLYSFAIFIYRAIIQCEQ